MIATSLNYLRLSFNSLEF